MAHQFEQAAINQDWESYVDAYNIELLYYVQNHELGTREDYIKMIQEAVQGKNTPKTGAGANRGLFESEPVYCPEKADEYNQTIKALDQMGQQGLSNVFKVDGAYIYRFQNQAAEEAGGQAGSGFQFSFGLGEAAVGMDIAVIRINGKWKVDMTLPFMQSFLTTMENVSAQN